MTKRSRALLACLWMYSCTEGGATRREGAPVDADTMPSQTDDDADREQEGQPVPGRGGAAGGSRSEPESAADAGPTLPESITRCGGAGSGFALPDDPALPGPWPVASRTVKIGDLKVEIWYPAAYGSEAGTDQHIYDLREWLPKEQASTIDEASDLQLACDCYRELPLDQDHGPYPVIVFLHGFSGFRLQSIGQMTHWASRGFVVLAPDSPGIGLSTFLDKGLGGLVAGIVVSGGGVGVGCKEPTSAKGNNTADAVTLLDALQAPSAELAFLKGFVDTSRIGVAGHSAGGGGIAPLSAYPGVKVSVSMSGVAGPCKKGDLELAIVMGGMEDAIVNWSWQQANYASAPAPKHLVGLARAGHMAFTAFCPIGKDQGGILNVAKAAGVEFPAGFEPLIATLASDGCSDESLPPQDGWEVANYVSSAAFEQVLLCNEAMASQLSEVESTYPDFVGAYRSER